MFQHGPLKLHALSSYRLDTPAACPTLDYYSLLLLKTQVVISDGVR